MKFAATKLGSLSARIVRERSDPKVLPASRWQNLPARYLISSVATRADGARRLRRFRVAQAPGGCGKPRAGKLRKVKRPEGRAPTLIIVAALNRYPARCRRHSGRFGAT